MNEGEAEDEMVMAEMAALQLRSDSIDGLAADISNDDPRKVEPRTRKKR